MGYVKGAPLTSPNYLYDGTEEEQVFWDPKDGELCLNKVKPEDTLVEACSGSEVQ
ncbi:hypothetical protein PPACK8108_LOCUS24198, partial [Phakopsora pachyrhizi]